MKERNLMPSGKGSAKKTSSKKAPTKKAAPAQESMGQRVSEGFDNFRRRVSPIYNLTNPKKKA
jgi:hypothetical protein